MATRKTIKTSKKLTNKKATTQKKETRLAALGDIAISSVPVFGSVYARKKGHKRGFEDASAIYAEKFAKLCDEKRQIRKDILGAPMFVCPPGWDEDFWQAKMNVFVKERGDSYSNAVEMLIGFLDFCIEIFPPRRLAETRSDLEKIRNVIDSAPVDRAGLDEEDIQLAIDFLDLYRGVYEDLRKELVASLPVSKSCNFLVLGKTGVGKSSLLNALLGVKKFNTGTGRPVTGKGIYQTQGKINGNPVNVFDSWGLETGTAYEEWIRMVEAAKEKHGLEQKLEDWFHAVIYCISAGGHRCEGVDIDTIRALLADNFYVVVALTKADQCSEEDAEYLRKYICKETDGDLLPCNVIETCVGVKTRSGESKPFGLNELKRAVLANYRETIKALLPRRCLFLARQELDVFCDEMTEWISRQEWKYDENENNRPFSEKCRAFLQEFITQRCPDIIRNELSDAARYGRNLAATIAFDDIDNIIPEIPSEMGFWESVGNWFAKTFNPARWFRDETKLEQERLQKELEKFRQKVDAQLERQQEPISRKIREIFDGACADGR